MDKILDLLEKNARLSIKDIAIAVGMDEEEVEKKIQEYEDNGVILGYKTIINAEALDGGRQFVSALIEVQVTPEKNVGFDNIAKRIYMFDEVKSCYLLSGSYDLLLVVEGEDIHTVSNFVAEKLAPMENVKATRTHFLLRRYKENGHFLVKQDEAKREPIQF